MKYSDCLRMQAGRQRDQIRDARNKGISASKSEYNSECASIARITDSFGLSGKIIDYCILSLIRNGYTEEEIMIRLSFIRSLLKKYIQDADNQDINGCLNDLLEKNVSLLYHTPLDLSQTITILRKSKLDETILKEPTFYRAVTSDVMYALVRRLESRKKEVSLRNLERLYIAYRNKNVLDYLVEKYPISPKVRFLAEYERRQLLTDVSVTQGRGSK